MPCRARFPLFWAICAFHYFNAHFFKIGTCYAMPDIPVRNPVMKSYKHLKDSLITSELVNALKVSLRYEICLWYCSGRNSSICDISWCCNHKDTSLIMGCLCSLVLSFDRDWNTSTNPCILCSKNCNTWISNLWSWWVWTVLSSLDIHLHRPLRWFLDCPTLWRDYWRYLRKIKTPNSF